MTTPRYLQQAQDDLAAATATAMRAEVRANLATRRGLAYAAVDDERTVYLVSHDGHIIGELHHPADTGAFTNWHARPDADTRRELGPFNTARQAAAALLHTHHA
ncbi:MAG: hypothetical protein ACRDRM_06610 [Pseudonocardiaceae bacterium]